MIQGETIVCLSTISWDYLWQRHQEFMARFARGGNRVLFVEPIGIRMPKWEDRHRIAARLKNRKRADARGLRLVMENVWALDPLVNPFQEIGVVHRRNVKALRARLQNALAQWGDAKPLVWIYPPTLLARAVTAHLQPRLVMYDCIDAYSENPKGVFSWYAESERELSRAADLVFVTSPQLMARQRPLNPHTYYVPPGVAYDEFARENLPEPDALKKIPSPRLMFFGGIDERVDIVRLVELAKEHPAWQFVMMGVVRTDVRELQRLRNAHFPGHISHDALPAYLCRADVLLLPYARSVFSRYIQPAKIFECLAVGKPIAAWGLPVFENYMDVMYVASAPAECARVIEHALDENDASLCERRRTCARANTWDARFQDLNRVIEERLQAKT